ncbi:hypothetical protein PsYK624_064700 [Phanerochaete sordida]|uniref:Uncharacterized protein n=1 Tax=Phanerochaete sordida TaxID=48140 RepID=A0A9P3LD87_9APHY|nr:hypothetical protein PsYK624_064700 [Phanerochaete sordida]
MKKELPSLIRRYLDERISWPQQNEERRNTFLRDMAIRFPCLERYEDAWPLKPFATEWLARRKRRGVKKLDSRTTTRSINGDRNAPTPERDRAASLLSSNQLTLRKQRVPVVPVQRTRQPIAELTARSSTPAREHECQSSPPRNLAKPTAPAASCTTEASVAVRRFLASLCPSMKELAAVFGLAGVRDRACLAALVAMTDVQQRAFLERLPLNLFQQEVVQNGLAARRC